MSSPSYMVLHPPHFFTVVLKLNLQHKKLRIPETFVTDYGMFLSSSVCLKLPDGKEWEVGLTTAPNGAVWLQNGWDEFAEYYNLEFGSFLVFRFDGESTFHTIIFNMNGSEIEYSCDFEESDYETLDSFSQESKQRKKASFSCLRSLKKTRNQDSFSPKMEADEEELGCNTLKDMSSSKKLRMTKDELNSESEKPSFRVVMTQSNVGGRFDMIIPNEFAAKYLSDEFGIIRLQISNGRTWSLVYKWNRNQGNFAYISGGWKHFAEENHLKKDDICFFQLIKKDKFLFTKLQVPSPMIPTTTTTKNPFFEVDIHSKSYRNPVQHIPNWFAREHLSSKMKNAKLNVGENQWKVKLKRYDDRARFTIGWTDFYEDNCLKDTSCLFEMINKEKCVFNVTISKIVSSTSEDEDSM